MPLDINNVCGYVVFLDPRLVNVLWH